MAFPNNNLPSMEEIDIAAREAYARARAAEQLPPKVRPCWCVGAICTKEGCQNFLSPDALRQPGMCKNCPYYAPRLMNCWCGLCCSCRPRPIGIGPRPAHLPR